MLYKPKARDVMKWPSVLFIVLLLCLAITPFSGLASAPEPARIRAGGNIDYSEETTMIGINVIYESHLWHPDLWTLLRNLDVSIIRFWDNWIDPYTAWGGDGMNGSERWKWVADNAYADGMQVLFVVAASGDSWWEPDYSLEALKERIDGYQVEKLRNHPGVWGYDLCNEPWGFITRSYVPQQGAEYIKQKDPTHLTTISLTSWGGDINFREGIEKTVDYVDVVGVHTYRVNIYGDTGDVSNVFDDFFRNTVEPYAKGKPIILTECGLWTEYASAHSYPATFTEEDQATYFTQVFNPCKMNSIVAMIPWKIVDNGITTHWGVYRAETDPTTEMNIPKTSVETLRTLAAG